eukprot:COSAG01_NODE_14354_length_1464_cov_0.891654_2_plen_357_part_01
MPCLALADDGSWLAVALGGRTTGGSLELMDSRLGLRRTAERQHTGTICGLALSSDGAVVVSCDGRAVLVHDGHRGQLLGQIDHPASCVAVSSDGDCICAGGGTHHSAVLYRWSTDTQRVCGAITLDGATLKAAVASVALCGDGSRALVGTQDGALACFDCQHGRLLWHVARAHRYAVRSLDLRCSQEGQVRACSCSSDGSVQLYDGSTGEVEHNIPMVPSWRGGVVECTVSLDGVGGVLRVTQHCIGQHGANCCSRAPPPPSCAPTFIRLDDSLELSSYAEFAGYTGLALVVRDASTGEEIRRELLSKAAVAAVCRTTAGVVATVTIDDDVELLSQFGGGESWRLSSVQPAMGDGRH